MGDVVLLRGFPFMDRDREQLTPEKLLHSNSHGESLLDDVLRSVLSLAEDELLPALELALELAINAKDQGDEASFYHHIMTSNTITSRILLNGGRL